MQASTTDGAPESTGVDEAASVGRRQALQKFAVGGAVIWGAPLIMGSAPAQAAGSICGPRKLRWRTLSEDPLTLPKVAVVDDVTVTISQTFSGGSTSYSPSGDPDLDVLDGPYGGVGASTDSFLQFYQSAVEGGGRQVTFAFSKPVKGISFWITDIDYAQNQYDDRVFLTPTFTRVNPTNSTVVTSVNSYPGSFANSATGNVDVLSVRGTTRASLTASVSSFTLDFLCGGRAYGGNHAIFISDLEFNSCP